MARSNRLDPAADLFAAEALPEGLTYRPDFISPREEAELLEQIRTLPLVHAPYRQYTARRRVASFGFTYNFQAQTLNEAPALPAFLLPLRARIASELKVLPDELAQGLVTAYDIGTPLGWHRDAPEFGSVAGVSLAGSCEMRWRPYPPQAGRTLLSLTVAARSLYLITGEARWGWQHSVAATRELRYSITFRTLRARRAVRQA
jgi:alkylated DNA repair dioxygenase AlkB